MDELSPACQRPSKVGEMLCNVVEMLAMYYLCVFTLICSVVECDCRDSTHLVLLARAREFDEVLLRVRSHLRCTACTFIPL